MKKKMVWIVEHTTETGAPYAVKTGLKDRIAALQWIDENKKNYERELRPIKITY